MKSLKIILVGEAGVGKTSIVQRLTEDVFDNQSNATVGSANTIYTLKRDKKDDITLKIWDTAGQERYRSLIPMFFNGAAIAFIVYDITNEDSFIHLKEFHKLIEENAPEEIKCVLIGNKNDLDSERKIPYESAVNYGDSIGASFYVECSAKSGVGIKELFQSAVEIPNVQFECELSNYEENDVEAINENEGKTDKKCC
ncbi:small GTP-binding protein [Histomonas meleagridis]|uniref:small GTP-binding protein n=1 Tax=Histomonas meleagridis TaxID=135588 RepID=UPI00355A4036|nr:small GTP-binding protein [Histomonas meleagridis]KAH0797183.1 small GTP-binding protein [Histomonas meleagridis]